jgi:hypothetical protein
MKVDKISNSNGDIRFKSQRTLRNTVSQLAKNNRYSLTAPNQRAISNAIKELGKISKPENIRFLLDTAASVTYRTNIKLQDAPANDWKSMLLAAVATAVASLSFVPKYIRDRVNQVSREENLKSIEKEILALRKDILKLVDLEQIKRETIGTTKDFEKNLDYLIVSSETTLEHKKYVLERLKYFMSDDYSINPQLTDKKSIVIAEMVNDMAINVPGNQVPNIKAVNQKQHGMCAAISIVRKKLAYEDKPNYVDSLLSELDASNGIEVYDRSQLGTGKKTVVEKIPVDFETAMANGYRIIDASTMHWMQIAQMSGGSNLAFNAYTPFDAENFDVNTDAFFNVRFEDPALEKTHIYYQALVKAKDVIESYKAKQIKKSEKNENILLASRDNDETKRKINTLLINKITNLSNDLDINSVKKLLSGIYGLAFDYSDKIKDNNPFAYIPNEESIIKKEKIKNYILQNSKITNISEKSLEEIFDLVEYHHEIISSEKLSKDEPIKRARNLYEVAASFRNQIVCSLEESQTLENVILSEGLPNKEAIVLDTIDMLIDKLENNSSNSQLIIEQLAPAFDGLEKTKEDTIEGLKFLKETISSFLTEDMNDIYAALTLGSKKEALLNYLENIKMLVDNNNKPVIKSYAKAFGVKTKEEISRNLELLKNKVKNGNEQAYNEVFTALGNTSQIKYISDLYTQVVEKMGEEDNTSIVMNFLTVNGLSIEDDDQPVIKRLEEIKSKINGINSFIQNCTDILQIKDENGYVLYSANPKDVIIKKLENRGQIVSSKNLKELQEHLNKIAKDRSSDEFQSRQGKLKEKSLYEFSKTEKATLNEIEERVNDMYAYVKKQINYVQTDLKDKLEVLKRLIGVNEGNFWVSKEGSSGLSSQEQIRVLEYMTGRQHYSSENIRKSLDKIKNSPYSAISTSSVFHNDFGMHAQYVADIEPIKVKSKDKKGNVVEEVREVLFQDNTWGPSERENTWIDSYGLKRTDYSDYRGGSLGYITNDKMQNGNFVDRILNEMTTTESPDYTQSKVYKRIKHVDNYDSYSIPQYRSMILDGKAPDLKTTTDRLHDAIFLPPVRHLNNFIEVLKAENKTTEALKAMLTDAKGLKSNWRAKYEEIKRRIFPSFGPGIATKEDYDKLRDDDYLKVILEKVAISENPYIPWSDYRLATIKNVKKLGVIRGIQKNKAIAAFKYAFGKDRMSIQDYVSAAFDDAKDQELTKLLKKHNPNIKDEDLDTIGRKFSLDTEKFDGSARTTIELIMENLSKDIRKVLTNEDSIKITEDFFRNFLNETIYFNASDLNNSKIKHIIKFIDKEFNPVDDGDFVHIYRRLQNMTTAEFKEKVLSKASYEDLGIENITGYDILKRIQLHDESMNNALINAIFYDNQVANGKENNSFTEYRYRKLSKEPRYLIQYSFDDLYHEMKNDLSLLTLEKLFNQYKGRNLDKHGAFPAYPKSDYMTTSVIDNTYEVFINGLDSNVNAIKGLTEQIENYEIAHKLVEFQKSLKTNHALNEKEFKEINAIISRFIQINSEDTSIEDILQSAEKILEIPQGSIWGQYLPLVDAIVKRLTDFENTTSKEILEQSRISHLNGSKETKEAFAYGYIQTRHRNQIIELINKIEQALIKNEYEQAEILKNKLYEDFRKYHILQNPEELLELFILSHGTDSTLAEYKETYKIILQRALNFAMLNDVQEILMDAVGDGTAMNLKNQFNNYKINYYGLDFPMGSNVIISYMVNSLVIDGQIDTALLFVDKLGLTNTYLKHMEKEFNFEEMKNLIFESHTEVNNFNQFKDEINISLEKISVALKDNNADFPKLMSDLRILSENIAKKYSISEEVLTILNTAINNIEYTCNENPDAQKGLIYDSLMAMAKNDMVRKVRENISARDDILEGNSNILNLINNLALRPGSEEDEIRERICQKFTELAEYKNQIIDLHKQKKSDKI